MKIFPTPQIFVTFGPFSITYYAIFIVSAAILCYLISAHNLKKMGYSNALAEDLFFGAIPCGIIGARLWYVVFEWAQFAADPIRIFYIWEGGMGIYGGIFGGMLYGLYFAKKHKISYLRWADAIVPNLMLAQAIGRWGNYINQEAFGRVVSENFYRYFPDFFKQQMFIDGAYREPTFLYESVLNLVGFFLIAIVYRKYGTRKRGDLFYGYLAWYGVVRFFVEGLRSDALYFLGMRVSQLTSLVLIMLGVLGILGVFRRFFRKKPVVLFDLDGTLLDTKAVIFASFKHVFAKYEPELKVDDALLQTCFGPSLHTSFTRYSQKEPQLLIDEYIAYNLAHHEEYVKPFEGAKETLQTLRERGFQTGIVSTKAHGSLDFGLQLFDLTAYLDVVVAADDVKEQKPHPEGIYLACKKLGRSHDFVMYVGDNVSDIQAGKNADAFTVGVEYTDIKEALVAAEPDAMIAKLADVVHIAEEKFI